MTAIAPGSMPVLAGATPSAGGASAPAAGASFGDTLLTLLGRALVETPGEPRARFAAGTMRSSVEMFNERGFFEDRAPTDPRDSLLASDPDQPGAPQPTFPPLGALPILQSDPSRAPETAPPPGSQPGAVSPSILASDPAFSGQLAISGSPPVVPLRPGPAGEGAPVLSSFPAPRLRAPGSIVDGATSADGPPRMADRRDQALATSRVKVSLDHGEAGVAVTVVADGDPEGDAGSMHEAVAHLLARHGLVLSELRVSRSPGPAGQDRKD
jgi:hypothetical protein